ncbi:MAG: SRPBCC family protein [Halanaeroarchaeum sp.]
MAIYDRATVIDAPLSEVWAFHSTLDGLRALTPGLAGMEIGAVRYPDGDHDPDELLAGTEIEMRVRPLGILPGEEWTSEITERTRGEGEARFRDVMHDGPFERWEHTHRFLAVDDRTVVYDRLSFALPRPFGFLTPAVRMGIAALFAYRHARTRSLLGR